MVTPDVDGGSGFADNFCDVAVVLSGEDEVDRFLLLGCESVGKWGFWTLSTLLKPWYASLLS